MREDICKAALAWRGVPWRHQGRSRNGIDCIGLPVLVALELGIIDEAPRADYPRRPDNSFLNRLREYMTEKSVGNARPGDVLVFATATHPCHCGIMVTHRERPSVVHAHAGSRCVLVESLDRARDTVGPPIMAFAFPGAE